MTKLKQDASPSISGTIYQFYIALDKCFELLEGEKVIIEKYGDVSVSEKYQIEVKHYQEDLTDLHSNIWKTIDNWLQKEFNIDHYKNLILLTTQKFGVKSKFKNWNNIKCNEKKEVLDSIAEIYLSQPRKSEATKKLLASVLDSSKVSKLLSLLEKFIILDSSEEDSSFYEQIIQKHGKGVLPLNARNYIDSLMGYLFSPLIRIGDIWEITFEAFSSKVSSLVNEFRSGTVTFPKKYAALQVTDNEISQHKNYLFVKKIDDIEYYEAKNEAIEDYVRTHLTILNELGKYSIDKDHYKNYELELMNTYKPAYRRASRNTVKENCIKDSKNFYDVIIGSNAPQFIHFNDTQKFFRNGLLHGLANDTDDIIWKLKVDENE